MTMPLNLVLVRHGESEGNAALRASKEKGDDSYYTPEFLSRHSSQWRLTDKGIKDAIAAGEWLRQNFPKFDRYYTSEYSRALETAALLNLEDALWYRELYLRERDRGSLDVVSHSTLKKEFADEMAQKNKSSLFWSPPGGESIADVCMRVDRILSTLHRECADKQVIIVCHGEVMWVFRMRIERIPQEHWIELDTSEDKANKIFNGQIIHYSRIDPQSGAISSHLDWMRMIRATDESFSREWRPVIRPKFTNEQLLDLVRQTPRLINR